MFEDYYFDDPELQEALAASGYYTPAVEPMTVEAEPIMGIGSPAATPNYLSNLGLSDADLAALYALSANSSGGAGIGGLPSLGNLGANYVDTSGAQLITAPISNKGNPTAYGANNQFYIQPNELVRVVDRGTNSVVFEGVGPDAAREAVKIGQNLTDTLGRKADYQIQAGLTPDNYAPVANEKYNKSTLSKVANVAGTVLPMAMMAIPGVNAALLGAKFAATIPGQIAFGALTGAASSGLKGQNILKGAAMGGLGAAGGAYLGPVVGDAAGIGLRAGTAVGTGIGSTAGGLLTGQSLKNSLLSGAASGAMSYLSPDITEGLKGIGGGGGGGDGAIYGGPNADIVVNATPFSTSNIKLGGYKTPTEKYLAESAAKSEVDPATGLPYSGDYSGDLINVTGQRLSPGAVTGGVNLSGLSPEVIRAISEPDQTVADDSDLIKVTGNKIEPGGTISIGGSDISLDELDAIQRVNDLENANEEILVEGNKAVPVAINLDPGIGSITDTLPLPKADPALTEKSTLDKLKDAYDIARVGAALLPLIPSGGGGNTGGIGSGTGSGLTFTNSPLRPTIPGGGIGGIGGAGGYPYTPQTYGRRGGDQETEYLFFTRDPVTGQGSLQSAPAPITTPIANEAAAPAMIAPSGNAFAEGGEVDDDMVKHLVEYHKNGGHQGPGQVKGIGSGQDDKIPAWLSDGEYVWSAQDVADLGDGSTDEGVRRLDKMRQMVRRQAGRKDVKKIAKPQKGIDRMLKAVGGLA
jgi:hypothetical protein